MNLIPRWAIVSVLLPAFEGAMRGSPDMPSSAATNMRDTSECRSATIAASVEQQGSATQEIARNVVAAQGTGQASTIIAEVNQEFGKTGMAATHVLASADRLGAQTETLRSDVGRFLTNMRVA